MPKGKCKKNQSRKVLDLAVANTRRNKIAKFTRICKKNPNDHAAFNTLNQLLHDAGKPLVKRADFV